MVYFINFIPRIINIVCKDTYCSKLMDTNYKNNSMIQHPGCNAFLRVFLSDWGLLNLKSDRFLTEHDQYIFQFSFIL